MEGDSFRILEYRKMFEIELEDDEVDSYYQESRRGGGDLKMQ